ncbi:MAG: hypothetical protein NXI08_09980 [bacterium]|nr:hypothetical protein [bacterium]
MLRFFRQIRQKLLENGNLRKYFWYALGEIFLVMIGILLALQVNNWNENRKIKILESKLLSQVSVALKDDIDYFEMLISRMDRSQSSAKTITNLYLNDIQITPDSLINLTDDLVLGYLFVYNEGPYEAIKSTGLDIISDDDIREKLTNLYGFRLKRVNLALNDDNDWNSLYASYYRNILDARPYLENDGNIGYRKALIVEDIFKDDEFWILFRNAEFQSRQAVGRIKNTIPHMEELKTLIDKFLAN